MRYESSVTSLSWIPSEAVTGATRTAFDSGFTHYDAPPPAGAAAALHPVAGATGMDHAVADPARRRPGRVLGHRRQPVPPALDLRRRRPPGAQVGPDRLRQLDPGVVRPPHALGRRGFPGPGDGGRDRAGADPVRAAHALLRQAEDHPAPARRRTGPPG